MHFHCRYGIATTRPHTTAKWPHARLHEGFRINWNMSATFMQSEALWMNYHSRRTKGSGEAYAVQ